MPDPVNRESLDKTLDGRYLTQHAGGAFDVKQTLGPPGTSPSAGTVIDAISLQGSNFQAPNGFQVKVIEGITQLKDAQGTKSKELSLYIRGFSSRRYKP